MININTVNKIAEYLKNGGKVTGYLRSGKSTLLANLAIEYVQQGFEVIYHAELNNSCNEDYVQGLLNLKESDTNLNTLYQDIKNITMLPSTDNLEVILKTPSNKTIILIDSNEYKAIKANCDEHNIHGVPIIYSKYLLIEDSDIVKYTPEIGELYIISDKETLRTKGCLDNRTRIVKTDNMQELYYTIQ